MPEIKEKKISPQKQKLLKRYGKKIFKREETGKDFGALKDVKINAGKLRKEAWKTGSL